MMRSLVLASLLCSPLVANAASLESLFTIKQGELTQDENWSGKILLVSDVVVPPGRTLTIAPGTWLVFNEADFDNRGKHARQAELIVNGSLIAESDDILLSLLSGAQVQKYIQQQGPVDTVTIAPQPVTGNDLTQDWKKYKHNYALLWAMIYSLWLIF